ncbi:MAG TPA: hypothetical protein VN924_25995 [Bryobacteraceae bacterium]|nr:hypothetical protein [Bryobacteraceae bacterium]
MTGGGRVVLRKGSDRVETCEQEGRCHNYLLQATTKPSPHVSFDGPALKFDFPEVRIGVAEYEEGRF